MIKEWYTARELAELSLDGLPATESGTIRRAKKENWQSRPRLSRGGGVEYHTSNLPETVKIQIVERLIDVQPEALQIQTCEGEEETISAAEKRKNAKVLIVKMFYTFMRQSGLQKTEATQAFARLYAVRKIDGVPEWVYEVYSNFSAPTLHRWRANRKNQEFTALKGAFGNRKGSGVLDTAENGEVKEFIVGLMLAQHHLKAGHIRDLTRAKFGSKVTVYKGIDAKEHPLPNIRTFERFMLNWKNENAALHLKITNPDASKSKNNVSLGQGDADVMGLNHVWEIDASPVDILLNGGRYNLYAIIDLWSRRLKIHISKTATTEASLQLVRKAILDWGVPEEIRTDNGSDFISQRFVGALSSLDIHQHTCAPFSPEKKPYVERVIGTLQRDLMPLLPGFIGHNVKDRSQIEARKTFAQRLGVDDSDAFAVGLNQDELQKIVDEWCENKYAHRVHSTIKQSPFAKAASWTQPIKRIENERAIDILLAPLPSGTATRKITKNGIKIDGYSYGASEVGIYIGDTVFIRCDPEDMGAVHCFHPETKEFLFTATCPELTGGDRKKMAMEAKAAQKKFMKDEMAKARRNMKAIKPENLHRMVLDQAREDSQNITAFPQKSESYSAKEIDEAQRVDTKSPIDNPVEDEIAKRQAAIRYEMANNVASKAVIDADDWWKKAQEMILRQKNGGSLSGDEEEQLEIWKSQPWFKSKSNLMKLRMEAMSSQ